MLLQQLSNAVKSSLSISFVACCGEGTPELLYD
jgi:hypothetical protein